MSLLTSLQAHWKLNAASGNETDSHSSLVLVDTNSCGSGTGTIGNARTFAHASSRYFTIADNAALSMGDIDFAIAVWVNVNNLTNLVCPVRKRTSSANTATEYRIDINTNGSVTFVVGNGSTSGSISTATGVISTGTWYLILAWHDATADTLNLQIDGASPITPVSYASGSHDSTAPMDVGRSQGNTLYFDGLIDSLSIWKKTLDATDRSNLWNGGAGLDYESFSGAGPQDFNADSITNSSSVDDATFLLEVQLFEAGGISNTNTVGDVIFQQNFLPDSITNASSVGDASFVLEVQLFNADGITNASIAGDATFVLEVQLFNAGSITNVSLVEDVTFTMVSEQEFQVATIRNTAAVGNVQFRQLPGETPDDPAPRRPLNSDNLLTSTDALYTDNLYVPQPPLIADNLVIL